MVGAKVTLNNWCLIFEYKFLSFLRAKAALVPLSWATLIYKIYLKRWSGVTHKMVINFLS